MTKEEFVDQGIELQGDANKKKKGKPGSPPKDPFQDTYTRLPGLDKYKVKDKKSLTPLPKRSPKKSTGNKKVRILDKDGNPVIGPNGMNTSYKVYSPNVSPKNKIDPSNLDLLRESKSKDYGDLKRGKAKCQIIV